MKHFSLSVVILFGYWWSATVTQGSDLRLWYNAPGVNNLAQGLMLGNGRLGLIVPGNVTNENIVLNESSLWAGTANPSGNFDNGPKGTLGAYQLFGHLQIKLPDQSDYTGYKRVLDLATGVATVTYTDAGVAYTRTLFCSLPDQVAIVQLTADKPAAYTGSIQLTD